MSDTLLITCALAPPIGFLVGFVIGCWMER